MQFVVIDGHLVLLINGFGAFGTLPGTNISYIEGELQPVLTSWTYSKARKPGPKSAFAKSEQETIPLTDTEGNQFIPGPLWKGYSQHGQSAIEWVLLYVLYRYRLFLRV